ncbi:RsmE family RNA methyltransferase [Tautonia rosea]|uniref:RsmE family RNA methyltransferase n=1 Tax=Tautonia rosea TaxID=2728037 RepID=UPI00147310BD|nr:RsmE family RNA methyltransferase [Tautonia rosea]
MERVYFPGPLVGDLVEVTGPEAHHLTRVRRIGPGDPVQLFDGQGGVARGRVDQSDRNRVEIRIESRDVPRPVPPVQITLATAIPKGDRFDWLIEKSTELGVARIIPLRTNRSVVDPRSTKLDRLRRLVVEACKQSGRDHLLQIETPVSWTEFLETHTQGLRLIAHPEGEAITPCYGSASEIALAIGPEGGFTVEEIDQGVRLGWKTFGLGPNILRIETAGIAASAAFLALNPSEVPTTGRYS